MMTAETIARLQFGETDLTPIGPSLFADFKVRQFKDCEIVWLNRRWFCSKAVDLGNQNRAAEIEYWLLNSFGVGVVADDAADAQFVGPEIVFKADRYGATGGSTQGGSGRVGTQGYFNVKGVGPTPLVSKVADWQHSHGHMWLEEAIREAIYSEIVQNEFPHGAVPVIAILATGIRHEFEDSDEEGERALVVRPNFTRLATLQRSIFFGSSGFKGSDQYIDEQRTRGAWRYIAKLGSDIGTPSGIPVLLNSFKRLGEQYGYGHATKLWPGPIFASNVTIDGRLADFGSVRVLPGWGRAQSKLRSHSFGGERPMVVKLANSLAVTGAKHGMMIRPSQLADAYDTGREIGFATALHESGALTGSREHERLLAKFGAEQRITTTLWDVSGPGLTTDGDSNEPSLLQPRPRLFRETLRTRAQLLADIRPTAVEGRRAKISRFIEHEIELARRGATTRQR